MSKKKNVVALIYDFDGTLSPGNMQEFGFIQAIGKGITEFWAKNKELSEQNDANGILCYMYLMLRAKESTSKCNLFANLSVMFEKDLIWIHEV